MAKQVSANVEQGSVQQQNSPQVAQNERNLYVTVDTLNTNGDRVGTRIVDMYHFGTRSWLQNHHWWAMHNGHMVEVKPASDEQITAYVASQTAALAAKFGKLAQAH